MDQFVSEQIFLHGELVKDVISRLCMADDFVDENSDLLGELPMFSKLWKTSKNYVALNDRTLDRICKRHSQNNDESRITVIRALDALYSFQLLRREFHEGKRYDILNRTMIAELEKTGLLDGTLFGPLYFLEQKRSCIIEIEVLSIAHDAHYTGTGIVTSGFDISKGRNVPFLFTALHNLQCNKSGEVYQVKCKSENTVIQTKKWHKFNRIDVAFCEVANSSVEDFATVMYFEGRPLDKVVSVGFPRLFRPDANPLLFHAGEINGWIGRKEQASLQGIFSCQVNPGNSGGAVFGNTGGLLGLITEKIENEFNAFKAVYNCFVPYQQIEFEFERGDFDPL